MNSCHFHVHSQFWPCENGLYADDVIRLYPSAFHRPTPGPDMIDARRDDGCIPVITRLPPRLDK